MKSISSKTFAGIFLCSVAAGLSAADSGIDSCMAAVQQQSAGNVMKLEKLNVKGKTVYELETKSSAGVEKEFMCDAASGTIIETEGEADSAEFKKKAKVSEEEAAKIALKAHPGRIEEVEYELESDGSLSYEFDIVDDKGLETKVEVDAASGKIIEESTEEWEVGEEADERR